MEISAKKSSPSKSTRWQKTSTFRFRASKRARTSQTTTYARPMGTAFLGPKLRTKLVYSTGEGYVVNSVAATSEEKFTFAANNMFDPDTQVGGQQPVGFDQLAAIYDRYKVINCTIDLLGLPASQCIICVYPSTSSTPLTTIQDATSQYGAKIIAGGTFTGPVNNMRVYIRKNSAKFMGIPQSDDDIAASTAGGPDKAWYWHVHCYNPSGGALVVGFMARLTFDVEFCRPKALTVS